MFRETHSETPTHPLLPQLHHLLVGRGVAARRADLLLLILLVAVVAALVVAVSGAVIVVIVDCNLRPGTQGV